MFESVKGDGCTLALECVRYGARPGEPYRRPALEYTLEVSAVQILDWKRITGVTENDMGQAGKMGREFDGDAKRWRFPASTDSF